VLVRDALGPEALSGGFAAVYPILRALEDAGRIRRGYFVEGLGGAQFALAGAIERLRAVRDARPDGRPVAVLLAAADPASPFGAALPWPRRGEGDRRVFARAAGAYVVSVDGAAALYVERGGSGLQTMPAFDDAEVATAAVAALRTLVEDGRLKEFVVRKVDGEAVADSAHREALLAGGFQPGYRGLVLRPGRRG
jgi:ATP-dependent Lhr-like helicase